MVLTWDPPAEQFCPLPDPNNCVPDVTGYNVYRGTFNGGPYTLQTSSPINALDYNDLTPALGATYYYVVTAINVNGESALSNQTTATIPAN